MKAVDAAQGVNLGVPAMGSLGFRVLGSRVLGF